MIIGDSYVRSTALIGFAERVDEAGGNVFALLDAAGIANSALSDVDALISYRSYVTLLEISTQRLNRPDFGLEWVVNTGSNFPALGPLALLANFVDTVDEWLTAGLKYWRFHTNAFTLRLATDPGSGDAVLTYYGDPFVLPARQISEMILGNICAMARAVTGRTDENPKLIRFQHNQPKNLNIHHEIFRCPVEFNADQMEIVFDAKILRYKTNGNLKLLKPFVSSYMKYRIARMPLYDASMTTTVALAIPSVLGTGHCGIDVIAEALGMHTKRLQRMLVDEGTNFSDILEHVRDRMARRFLIESDMPVERIAGLLDYSSTPPFSLAFKRWTGQTPLAFRKSERLRLGRSDGGADKADT
jgi:AraC-like DNA-binding protein